MGLARSASPTVVSARQGASNLWGAHGVRTPLVASTREGARNLG